MFDSLCSTCVLCACWINDLSGEVSLCHTVQIRVALLQHLLCFLLPFVAQEFKQLQYHLHKM